MELDSVLGHSEPRCGFLSLEKNVCGRQRSLKYGCREWIWKKWESQKVYLSHNKPFQPGAEGRLSEACDGVWKASENGCFIALLDAIHNRWLLWGDRNHLQHNEFCPENKGRKDLLIASCALPWLRWWKPDPLMSAGMCFDVSDTSITIPLYLWLPARVFASYL